MAKDEACRCHTQFPLQPIRNESDIVLITKNDTKHEAAFTEIVRNYHTVSTFLGGKTQQLSFRSYFHSETDASNSQRTVSFSLRLFRWLGIAVQGTFSARKLCLNQTNKACLVGKGKNPINNVHPEIPLL